MSASFIKNSVWILLLYVLSSTFANAQDHEPQIVEDSVVVYVFMLEDCLLTQNYTLALRQLYETYSPYHIDFIGLFPNSFSTYEKIDSFQQKYEIPFLLQTDHSQTKTQQLGATVTPEAVIYNYTKEAILYKGRIDNAYYRVGRRRGVTTSFDLKNALEAIILGKEIEVKETEAIGCFINLRK